MDIISQYILSLAPTITSVIGIIVALIVGVKKIKSAGDNTNKRIEKIEKESEENSKNIEAIKDSICEVKMQGRKVSAKLDHVNILDKKEK